MGSRCAFSLQHVQMLVVLSAMTIIMRGAAAVNFVLFDQPGCNESLSNQTDICVDVRQGKGPLADVWALDTAAKPYEWRKLEPEGDGPPPCMYATASAWSDGLLLLCGGGDASSVNGWGWCIFYSHWQMHMALQSIMMVNGNGPWLLVYLPHRSINMKLDIVVDLERGYLGGITNYIFWNVMPSSDKGVHFAIFLKNKVGCIYPMRMCPNIGKCRTSGTSFLARARSRMSQLSSTECEGKSWSSLMSKLQTEFPLVQLDSCKFWPVVAFLNYRYIPQQLRVLFANVAAVCWSVLNLIAHAIHIHMGTTQ